MRPALVATACALPAVWLAYRAGKERAYRDTMILLQLLALGRAQLNDDGTVSLVEEDTTYEQQQRQAAPWQ